MCTVAFVLGAVLAQLLRCDPFNVYTEYPRCSTNQPSSWVGQKPSSPMWSPRLLSLQLPSHFIFSLGRGGGESLCTHMQLDVQPKTIGGPVQISGAFFLGSSVFSPQSPWIPTYLLNSLRLGCSVWVLLPDASVRRRPPSQKLERSWRSLLSLSSESTVVSSVSSSISTQLSSSISTQLFCVFYAVFSLSVASPCTVCSV